MPTNAPLFPRTHLVALTAFEVEDVLLTAGFGDDPFDPRQAQALAAAAFQSWAADELEHTLDEQEAVPLLEVASIEELQRPYPTVPVRYRGHPIVLVIASRREGAAAPVRQAVPERLVEPGAVVCCVYLQVDSSGEWTGLLEGWIETDRLQGRPRETTGGERVVSINEAELRPMNELWARLRSPAPLTPQPAEPILLRLIRPLSRGRDFVWAAAVLLFLLLWLWRPAPPDASREKPPDQLAEAVVEMRLELPGRVRGAGGSVPVVRSGERWTITFRAATRHTHGWLYKVNARGSLLQARLETLEDGSRICRHIQTFDDTVGQEFFIFVISAEDVPPLDRDDPWLRPADREKLQDLADDGKDEEAARLIRESLRRAGWHGGDGDVRIVRVEHRAAR